MKVHKGGSYDRCPNILVAQHHGPTCCGIKFNKTDCICACARGVVPPLQVVAELRASVQRHYLDTLRRMDGALTNICAEFDPDKYTKVRWGKECGIG